ncbi:ARM repeat-containing protein, partial [Ramicandelaber brevisporus]
RDRDLSVRRRGLDLLYSMCDMAHARTIVHELLRFLNSTTDQSLRQEIVLKVAILAENYATEYSWYVDVMMRVLNAGDDCVGDEMWFRVVQVVLANEALQTYACQAAMDALASPASSESAVKVAAYILGEFGHLATESGQNAVYFSAADQLGALKNKLAVSNSSTRALILTSLLKQANLFPESRSSIIAIFQHYRHSLDVEIQQRASEYLTVVANPDAELLATVCEEIPPFPERESTLVSSLHRKHLDTVDKRTWIVGGAEANRELQRQHTQGKQSPSGSAPASATNSNQRSNNAGQQPPPLTARYTVYEDAARQQERSDARNLVELVEEQWRPSISNNGNSNNNNNNSNMDVVANESQSDKLMSSLDGILYADVNIQVGFKCEFNGSEGRVVLYIGNSSQRDLTDFDASINSEDDSLISTIQLPSPAQNVIKPRTQLMVKISLKCQSIFGSSPIVIIRYTLGQPRTLLLRLPVSITRFMNPVVLSAQDFFQRWKQLASPSNTNEESKECQLTLYSSLAETNSTNTSALRSIITGLGLSSLDGIDPNMGNIVGVGVINAGQLGNIGCLMRLEPSAEREMFRLTVRTTNPKTSTIVAAIIKRAISAIDDTNAN